MHRPALVVLFAFASLACGDSYDRPQTPAVIPSGSEPPVRDRTCFEAPAAVDFGRVSVGCGLTMRDVTLTNACAETMFVELVVKAGETCDFTLSGGDRVMKSLQAGQSLTFRVLLADEGEAGPCSGSLAIREFGRGFRGIQLSVDRPPRERLTQRWESSGEGFGFAIGYFLNRVPDRREPMIVTVDGLLLPERDPASGAVRWTYDGQQNALVLDPNWAPRSTMTVEYTPAALDCE